jgi:ABC-type glycerol-3-phosphate transport system substrate-binding protein
MKKFAVSVLPALVILSLLLTACGGGGAAQQTPAPTTSAGTSTEAAPTTAPTEAAQPTVAATEAVTSTTTTEAPTAEATSSTGASAGGVTLPASCTGTVELNYWNPFTGPDGPFMGQMVDAFNAANPNIKVTMTTQSEYMTQYQTAARPAAWLTWSS